MSEYFLGVDGGQSSTIALIGDAAGKTLGWASAGPCNHVSAAEGRAKFLRVMRECLSQAAAQADLDPARLHFRAACLGMSGGPEDKAALLQELISADRLLVTTDAKIALAGATGGAPGIIVIAGTGSIAFAENELSETARAGGWGYIFGDEGGGFDIVRQALRSALAEHEGWGPRTALTPALLEASQSADANQALHRFYTQEWPHSRIAALARVVDQIAESGDPVAEDTMQRAAMHLAMLAGTVRRQLGPRRNEADGPLQLAWIGGVFNSAIVLDRFRMLVELEGSVRTAPPLHSPAMGALLTAWKLAGISASPEQVPGIKT